jgi:hypothetical protein
MNRVRANAAATTVHTMSVHFLSFSRLLAKIVTFERGVAKSSNSVAIQHSYNNIPVRKKA